MGGCTTIRKQREKRNREESTALKTAKKRSWIGRTSQRFKTRREKEIEKLFLE